MLGSVELLLARSIELLLTGSAGVSTELDCGTVVMELLDSGALPGMTAEDEPGMTAEELCAVLPDSRLDELCTTSLEVICAALEELSSVGPVLLESEEHAKKHELAAATKIKDVPNRLTIRTPRFVS